MKKILYIIAGVAMAAGLSGCMDLGWSVGTDFDGTPDVGLYLNGGGFYGPPAPATPPPPPQPAFGGPQFCPGPGGPHGRF